MTGERHGIIKFRGQDVTILGQDLRNGDSAPEFIVQAQDWSLIKGLSTSQGKTRVIAAVPSLDTDVCDRETRRFNEEATSFGQDVIVQVISADLPFAQKRWCGAAGIERVVVLSDHLFMDFGSR